MSLCTVNVQRLRSFLSERIYREGRWLAARCIGIQLKDRFLKCLFPPPPPRSSDQCFPPYANVHLLLSLPYLANSWSLSPPALSHDCMFTKEPLMHDHLKLLKTPIYIIFWMIYPSPLMSSGILKQFFNFRSVNQHLGHGLQQKFSSDLRYWHELFYKSAV